MSTAKLAKVGCEAPIELRAEANAAAAELGITLAEYLRMAMVHLARNRTNPFTERSAMRRPGRPATYIAA